MQALAANLDAELAGKLTIEDQLVWDRILPLIRANGLEAALLAEAPSASLEAILSSEIANQIISAERRVIAEVFQGRVLPFSRLLKHFLKPPSGIPVITTNYDRLIELASESAGLGVDSMFVGHFAGELNEQESRLSFCREVTVHKGRPRKRFKDRVNIFKPHGSLDWYLRAGLPVRFLGDISLPRLIITPGVNKFRNGYQSPFDRHRECANAAIDRASRFLVIGYGFNDDHLETHLIPRIRSGVPTLILTHALSTNSEALAVSNSNVVSLDHYTYKGNLGTRVIQDKLTWFIPDSTLWDLSCFISEVLEP